MNEMKKRNYNNVNFQKAMQYDNGYNFWVVGLPVLGFLFLLIGIFSAFFRPENTVGITTVPTWFYFAFTATSWFIGQKVRRRKYDNWLRRNQ